MKILHKTNINFIAKRYYFFALSTIVTLTGIISIYKKGLNLGLDFTGGSYIQIRVEGNSDISLIREALIKNNIQAQIKSYDNNSFGIMVKGKQENVNEYADKIISALNSKNIKFIEEKREFVGPVVGKDLAKKAIFSIVLSFLGIIIYIAFRFSNPVWGITGVIGLVHDVFVAITAMSLTNREIDLVIVAALLTIAGYSINDTIVIYDRMRENIRNHPKMPFGDLINLSINETLSRTIITSLTVIMVLVILFLFGGHGIEDFSFCMLVGSITGVYSTVALATPIAYEWQKE